MKKVSFILALIFTLALTACVHKDLITPSQSRVCYSAWNTQVSYTHSEQSGVTALDFMVEQMTATPLTDKHRTALSAACRQVIEETTKRGFRVKLII